MIRLLLVVVRRLASRPRPRKVGGSAAVARSGPCLSSEVGGRLERHDTAIVRLLGAARLPPARARVRPQSSPPVDCGPRPSSFVKEPTWRLPTRGLVQIESLLNVLSMPFTASSLWKYGRQSDVRCGATSAQPPRKSVRAHYIVTWYNQWVPRLEGYTYTYTSGGWSRSGRQSIGGTLSASAQPGPAPETSPLPQKPVGST